MSLRAQQLSVAGGPHGLRLRDIDLEVSPGRVHALLGANGAGKTTLLRVLAGDLRYQHGIATLDDHALPQWRAAALAQRRAVFAQHDALHFPLSVAEVVALGRLPHRTSGVPDETAVTHAALAQVEATALADRNYLSLSGGERARVRLARALAQVWEQWQPQPAAAPRYLLLDEPAAALDPAFQQLALQVVRRFADAGGGALLSVHDPNLALRYADTATLLHDGAVLASGVCAETLRPEVLHRAYGVAVMAVPLNGRNLLIFGDD